MKINKLNAFSQIALPYVILLGICLGVLYRIIAFGQIPLSLNRDEASIGYNAFAIATEGIDEWGKSWPLMFKAFGDYKLPGYIYTLVPFIKLLGTENWVIRLPSLLAGLANLLLIYLLGLKLFAKSKLSAQLLVLFTAASPWAIHYSKVAFEAHLALSLTLLSLWLMLEAISKPNRLILSMLILSLAMNTYNTPLLLSPIILGSYLVIYRQHWRQHKQVLLLSLGLYLCLTAATVAVQYGAFAQKSHETSIYTHPYIAHQFNQLNISANESGFPRSLIVNKFSYYSWITAQRYFNSFSPKFLVIRGGSHPWHSIPGWAHFSLVQYIIILTGLVYTLSQWRKLSPAVKWLMLLFFAAPLPAIITYDAPHATRSLLMFTLAGVPALVWLSGRKPSVQLILVALMLFQAYQYTSDYLHRFPQQHLPNWKVGLVEAIDDARNQYTNQTFTITNTSWSPYVYVLLHDHVPPSEFVSQVKYYPIDTVGYEHVAQFKNYTFVEKPNEIPPQNVGIHQQDDGTYAIIAPENL